MDKFHFSEGPLEGKDNLVKFEPKLAVLEEEDISIYEIPVKIFEELSAQFGEGKDFKIKNDGHVRLVQPLKADHGLTGFQGAIGFHTFMDRNIFVLWRSIPDEDRIDTIFEEDAMLTITAGVGPTRIHGGSDPDGVWVKLYDKSLFGLSLQSLTMKLIPLILWRAAQLAQNDNFKYEEYWDQPEATSELTK